MNYLSSLITNADLDWSLSNAIRSGEDFIMKTPDALVEKIIYADTIGAVSKQYQIAIHYKDTNSSYTRLAPNGVVRCYVNYKDTTKQLIFGLLLRRVQFPDNSYYDMFAFSTQEKEIDNIYIGLIFTAIQQNVQVLNIGILPSDDINASVRAAIGAGGSTKNTEASFSADGLTLTVVKDTASESWTLVKNGDGKITSMTNGTRTIVVNY